LANSRERLVLTEEGLQFVKRWFGVTRRVPSNVTREYQMLLHVCSFGGSISRKLIKQIGYEDETVEKALRDNYITVTAKAPGRKVKSEIARMVGRPARALYA